uniref:Guanine nucleotide-binding protein subunit gamma n=1 Tax=Geospiza parvula TaxID=87175 RepID=A0A8C3M5H9_GEOPR
RAGEGAGRGAGWAGLAARGFLVDAGVLGIPWPLRPASRCSCGLLRVSEGRRRAGVSRLSAGVGAGLWAPLSAAPAGASFSESPPRARTNKMKELVSNSTTSISQARKAVEQLKMEAYMDRIKVSKAAADLLAYCDAHIGEDPLIIPVPASENPFREKKLFCTIL